MNLLTVKQVAEKLSCSESWVWQLKARDPSFPRPFSLGLGGKGGNAKVTRWADEALDAWIRTKLDHNPEDQADENGRTGGEVHQAEGAEVTAQG